MTHRPINEPQLEVKTISFATASVEKEEEKVVAMTSSSNGFGTTGKERCPDLNLDLRICPPYQHQHQNQPHDRHQILKTGGRNLTVTTTLCFSCSLGILNSEECSCSNNGTSSSSSSTGYDFLGLENGVLDLRSLEMK